MFRGLLPTFPRIVEHEGSRVKVVRVVRVACPLPRRLVLGMVAAGDRRQELCVAAHPPQSSGGHRLAPATHPGASATTRPTPSYTRTCSQSSPKSYAYDAWGACHPGLSKNREIGTCQPGITGRSSARHSARVLRSFPRKILRELPSGLPSRVSTAQPRGTARGRDGGERQRARRHGTRTCHTPRIGQRTARFAQEEQTKIRIGL